MAYRRLSRLVPRDAHEQEAAATPMQESQLRAGDLVCFGPAERAHHIGFWLGEGRILHATGRDGVNSVVEEPLVNAGAGDEIRYVRL
jgi:cell wall-associated NlpC family hydrolase